MDELLPLIVKAVNILNRSNWCYMHQKYCVRGPVIANNLLDEINLLLLGSPCTVPCPHDTIYMLLVLFHQQFIRQWN